MRAPSVRLVVAAVVAAAGAHAAERGASVHADVWHGAAHRHKLTRGRRANGGAPAAGAASDQAGSGATAAAGATHLTSQGSVSPPRNAHHARLSSGAVIGISIAVALGAVFALVASVVASTVVVRTTQKRRSRKDAAEKKKDMWVVDVPVHVRNTQ